MYKIKYSNKVKGGVAKFFFITINPKYKHDEGLLEHEKLHVKQWYGGVLLGLPLFFIHPLLALVGIGFHGLAYKLLRPYRQWAEVSAFKKQLELSPEHLDFLAKRLAEDYNLSITEAEAKELIRA